MSSLSEKETCQWRNHELGERVYTIICPYSLDQIVVCRQCAEEAAILAMKIAPTEKCFERAKELLELLHYEEEAAGIAEVAL